jgi:hypothetical protein
MSSRCVWCTSLVLMMCPATVCYIFESFCLCILILYVERYNCPRYWF